LYEVIKSELSAKFPTPSFSRVILPLSVILEGEFFNEYVKKGRFQFQSQRKTLGSRALLINSTGNVLMLSEGQRGITNMFSLKDGN
jgi:ribonuclease P/MRP protein subunit RPP40